MTSCFKGTFKVTSPRSYRTLNGKNDYHPGLDMVGVDDTSVYAVADGTIDATPYEKNGFGYYVRQLLPDGRRVYYGHLKAGSICVKPGQKVKKGDRLGVMGNTGNSFGAHTHLEIRPAGTVKSSLDICEFTGIPNKKGTYYHSFSEKVVFADVPETHWAYHAISELCEKGIFEGYADGSFRPDEPVTRAELAVAVYRLEKQ